MPLIANYTLDYHCHTSQRDSKDVTYKVVQEWSTHCERSITQVCSSYFHSSMYLLEDYDVINEALELAIKEARYLVRHNHELTPRTKDALTSAIILLRQLTQMVTKAKTKKEQQR